MSTKAPSQIDQQVGTRIRLRRMEIGMSQERLAGQLGVTFQQVQKYERGANRISVSRLMAIAEALGVPVPYFFSDGSAAEVETRALVADRYTLELLRAFEAVEGPAMRRAILELTRAAAASHSRRSSSTCADSG